jgi:hypothetical protein
MIPSLPGPGTPAFARLVKGLQPFGITPEGVSVDAPSSRLSEVVLGIVLLEKRVVVRITAESFDLFVTALFVGDDDALIEIANLVLAAIGDIDDEATKANAKIRTSSHLKLVSAEVDEFLSEHLKLGISIAGLRPDAAAYKVGSMDNLHSSDSRIVIAKSIGYANSVFVDMTANYADAPPAGTLASWVSSDFELITELLGLQEIKEGK